MNTLNNAPMVSVHPRRAAARKSTDELLEEARIESPEWIALFDDSCLHIPGAADLNDVIELIAAAPSERLAGYVEGLYVNN